jgi:hypothetical protein
MLMALTPLMSGRGLGVGFKGGKSRWAHYGFYSASSMCGAGRRGDRRQPHLAATRSGSSDMGGGR